MDAPPEPPIVEPTIDYDEALKVASHAHFSGDTDGAMEGQVIIVTDETGSAALEAAGQDPIIGSVTAGLESIDVLRDLQADNESITYRVTAAAVSTAG